MNEQNKNIKYNTDAVINVEKQLKNIVFMSSLVRRSQLFSGLGESYDGDRELYEVLGYKYNLDYADFVNIYSREGMGGRVNDAPCDALWRKPPRVHDNIEDSEFEKAFNNIVKQLRFWNKSNRADKLIGFGMYSIMFLGFNDKADVEELKFPIDKTKNLELLYIQTYSAEYASINEFDDNPQSDRYSLPNIYKIKFGNAISTDRSGTSTSAAFTTQDALVHWSRIIHVLEGNLQNEVFGYPRLERPYNRLKDIQKIVGGSGEMFWRGARPGYIASLQKEFNWDENDPALTDMQDQLKEYENDLRRFLFLQGVDIDAIETQVVDPSKHMDIQIQDLSAGTRIPKRILTGSERGELSSSQDTDLWLSYITERQTMFAEPVIIRPFVDRLIDLQLLPQPHENEYEVEWPDLLTLSDKEKAEIGLIRSKSLKEYLTAPGAEDVLPIEMFLRNNMGLSIESVKEALEFANTIEKELIDEENEIDEMDELGEAINE